MTTLCRWDGDTRRYTIYAKGGGETLLSGTADLNEFRRLDKAIREAERLAETRAREALGREISDLIEKRLHG